jgi:hypothetical protein
MNNQRTLTPVLYQESTNVFTGHDRDENNGAVHRGPADRCSVVWCERASRAGERNELSESNVRSNQERGASTVYV